MKRNESVNGEETNPNGKLSQLFVRRKELGEIDTRGKESLQTEIVNLRGFEGKRF